MISNNTPKFSLGMKYITYELLWRTDIRIGDVHDSKEYQNGLYLLGCSKLGYQ